MARGASWLRDGSSRAQSRLMPHFSSNSHPAQSPSVPSRRRSAYTLLELIATVVVLGIIALIAVGSFQTVLGRSEVQVQLARDEAVARNSAAILAFRDGTTPAQALTIAVSELPPAPGVSASNGYTVGTDASDSPEVYSYALNAGNLEFVTMHDADTAIGCFVHQFGISSNCSVIELDSPSSEVGAGDVTIPGSGGLAGGGGGVTTTTTTLPPTTTTVPLPPVGSFTEINSEAAFDGSGHAVAMSASGNRMAVSATGNDGNGSSSGHVRVFDWNGAGWTQVGADIDGEASFDNFGWSVAMSSDGSRIAVGAHQNDGNGANAGHVRVYDWNGTGWVQVGGDIDGENANDYAGWSVAMSADGSRVAVGAIGNDGNGADAGHVRVFDWNGSSWTQVGGDIYGEAAGDASGSSVAVSSDGSRVAVGARNADAAGGKYGAGHVRVFDWNGTAWVQVGGDIDGEASYDSFGHSVAMSSDGSRIAAGAYRNDGVGHNAGHARVFAWDGSSWVQVGNDIDGEASTDSSGHSVAMSSDGSRIAVGAIGNYGGNESGHVRVFDWNGSGWVQVVGDIDGEAAGDRSGSSVAMPADGSRVAVGATRNYGNGQWAGHVRVWVLPAAN